MPGYTVEMLEGYYTIGYWILVVHDIWRCLRIPIRYRIGYIVVCFLFP